MLQTGIFICIYERSLSPARVLCKRTLLLLRLNSGFRLSSADAFSDVLHHRPESVSSLCIVRLTLLIPREGREIYVRSTIEASDTPAQLYRQGSRQLISSLTRYSLKMIIMIPRSREGSRWQTGKKWILRFRGMELTK